MRQVLSLIGSVIILTTLLTSCIVISSAVFPISCTKEPKSISKFEKEVFEEINLARTNPTLYATFVEKRFSNRSYHLKEGYSVVEETIKFLQSVKPITSLAMAGCLYLAANDHVNDTGPKGVFGHEGSDGSDPSDRMKRYISGTFGGCGENISYGEREARNIIIQLLVDDGVASRGHRKNIFNEDFKFVGISVGWHKQYGIMCVQLFSMQSITNAREVPVE